MLKNYSEFINENQETQIIGKLFIESSDEEDTDWKLTIDVSNIWNQYENKELSLINFNNQYANELLKQNENINNINSECWNELETIINELKQSNEIETSDTIYDKIYDICDKCEILIKCE